jgi:hypothetical protein
MSELVLEKLIEMVTKKDLLRRELENSDKEAAVPGNGFPNEGF